MKKLSLIFFLSILINYTSFAQRFAENYWHPGKVFIEGGDTLSGDLKFDLQNEIVQVNSQIGLQTLTARKVLNFQFYDSFEQKDRYYYALPYAKVSSYQTPIFFELLIQGEAVTLLTRESLVTQTYVNTNPYSFYPRIPFTNTYLKNDFYFLYKSGKIKHFDCSKKGLLYLLNYREKDIKEYLKNNRVRYDSKQDMIGIIDYYNSRAAKK